jgi:uncharacterized protein
LKVSVSAVRRKERGELIAAKFGISKHKAGKVRFHLKAANGEIIAANQGEETKEGLRSAVSSVKTSAPAAKVVDLTEWEPTHN